MCTEGENAIRVDNKSACEQRDNANTSICTHIDARSELER